MLVVGFPAGPLEANCYLLAPEGGGECVIIDPGEDVAGPLAAALSTHGLTPVAMLATHGHPDHVASADEIGARHGIPLYLHEADRPLLGRDAGERKDGIVPLADGPLGLAGLEITVSGTPGHTAGSVVFGLTSAEGGRIVLTGDSLFAGSIGRSAGDGDELVRSLGAKVMTLPDDTVVLPGHGPATTIGQERAGNPFLAGTGA
ncbi:MBL fold metallo-hydrolase [Amycolatopsis roodepoortensis]|uniref:MBL fold metallo-hydrolase n=1 Tax=Amycolatopsis roodepoortensis TaxID=700274 RepID=UPI00214BB600|nr:MBL fold metallo-hydrolase [Amycolatopsis roodepoortensis]UUV31626.1 MBL fold metallo-hydrolase [Amycolatopsis roodepoortensis]